MKFGWYHDAHRPIRRDWCAFFMGYRIDSDTRLLIEEVQLNPKDGIIAPILNQVPSFTGLEIRGKQVLIKGQGFYKGALQTSSVYADYVPDMYKHGMGEDPRANQPDSQGGYIDHKVNNATRISVSSAEIRRLRLRNG